MHYSQNIATRTFVHQNFTPLLSLFKAALISLSPWSKELDKGNPSLDLGVEVVLIELGDWRGCNRLWHLAILGRGLARLPLGGRNKLLQLCQCASSLVSLHF